MKKTGEKKALVKSVKVKSQLSENQQDFNNAIEATEELRKNLKKMRSKIILFESYLKPHLSGDENSFLRNMLTNISSIDTTEPHTETDDANHTCEICTPTSIQNVYYALKYTISPMIEDIEEISIETGKRFKDTQQFIAKQPEKNREILRKIILIEIRNETVKKMMLEITERMEKLEKQADKLIIKKNKEEHKKNKGNKIKKLVN